MNDQQQEILHLLEQVLRANIQIKTLKEVIEIGAETLAAQRDTINNLRIKLSQLSEIIEMHMETQTQLRSERDYLQAQLNRRS